MPGSAAGKMPPATMRKGSGLRKPRPQVAPDPTPNPSEEGKPDPTPDVSQAANCRAENACRLSSWEALGVGRFLRSRQMRNRILPKNPRQVRGRYVSA